MDRLRHAGWAMVGVMLVATVARADDPDALEPTSVEVKAVHDAGAILTDGKGHYIAFGTPPSTENDTQLKDPRTIVFYGDGKVFYQVPVIGPNGTVSTTAHDLSWKVGDLRFEAVEGPRAELRDHDDVYTMRCQDRITPLSRVSSDEARALLAKASFRSPRMDRRAFTVGRDGTTYYYVDHAARPPGNKDFHVYIGKRGAMKRVVLTNSATDSNGSVFASKTGSLRISTGSTTKLASMTWVPRRGEPVPLLLIDIKHTPHLVYAELGIYSGKKFGLPCDDM